MIVIKRDTCYADRLRDYKIELDGTIIGTIADGQKKSFDVKPGSHVLRMKIDWGGSNRLSFQAHSGKNLHFKCASRARGAKVFLAIVYASVLAQRYIKLELVD